MIERIRLRNFRRYRDATVHFESGVNLVEGRNNVGKTTLFFAIEYAIFGRVESFKTIRSLMQPGKKSIGVEVVFRGRNGNRYLLQRIHQTPAKSKKTLDGHFTLKELLEDGERYLLASDFGDTEDRLALWLRELTGLTRRFFSVALHMRQGEIPAILEGSKQLDIVLGVTAAAMAEDELRQLAVELEKETAALPVLRERLRSLGNDLAKTTQELATLTAERTTTETRLQALGEVADPRAELDRHLAPIQESLAKFEGAQQAAELARHRVEDETRRHAEAIKTGTKSAVDTELAKLGKEASARTKKLDSLRADLDKATAEQRKLDTQRGDLAGRIERRQNLPKGKGAKCEVCGAPIKAADTAKELAAWTEELEQLDATLAESAKKLQALQDSLAGEHTAERAHLDRVALLTRQREHLAQVETDLAERQKEAEAAKTAVSEAFSAIRHAAATAAPKLKKLHLEAAWNLEGDLATVVASVREAVQSLRHSLAERVGRQVAERQALTELLTRFETQHQSLVARQTELERDQASALADAGNLEGKAEHAARFRTISASFKELQTRIRSEAATKLATDTIDAYRQLTDTDEFANLTIDPAQYSMQVTPRDLGEEVPAGLYEGGGQRQLLGLAYRLAVAKLVDPCPFLLLDEPTYGLDSPHRDSLLQRIGTHPVARQVLIVTHQAPESIPGKRVRIARHDRESVVEE